jgi:Carboxypeptidase regulatory-like domain
MRSGVRVVTLLAGLILAFSTLVLAQTATTSLRGTVYDPKGAVVSGAAVTITDPATGFTHTIKSDSQGSYQFLELPPAKYDLTVVAPSFGTLKQTGVELQVATPATLNFTMQVTGGTVTVEVSGTTPLVNTQDATLGHAFGAEQIADLPFEGRDPAGILSLQTGVVFTGNNTHISSASDSRSGSVNGARSDQTNITLDGVDDNDQLLGTAFTGAIRAPLDSLEELKVTTSNSDADTGRSSGGQVSEVTKSGTNHVHGSLYIYNRPTFTTGNDWFQKAAQLNEGEPNTPPFLLRNTFGANVGGPIIKDRLFFFAAYEGQRKREDMQVTRIVPSGATALGPGLRGGSISFPCDGVNDPNCSLTNTNVQVVQQNGSLVATLTAAQVQGLDTICGGNGTCPLGGGANPLISYLPGNPNSSAASIFNLYPQPNTDTVGDGFDFRGFTFASPLPQNQNAYVFKLDYNLTKDGNHRLFLKGIMNNDQEAERSESNYTTTGDGGEQFPGQPQNQLEHDNNKGITFGYTATFSSTLINNLRFGYVSQLLNLGGQQGLPYINFRGMDNLTAETPTINTHVPVKNFVDDVTKVVGSHSFQFGGNYREVDNLRESNAQNFFEGVTNVYWLNTSAIAGTAGSLDPLSAGCGCYPAVYGTYPNILYTNGFGASYDFAMAAMAGLIPQVNANYELNKALNVIPQGQLVPRHFRDHEYEFYGQDQWRLKPNLTFTYGLRYSILQPPYETTGTQVSPTISLNNYFTQRSVAASQGQVYDPTIQFGLSGQANGKQPYWAYDYKDFAPRIAFAYAPKGESGWSRRLWGGEGKTSIRVGYGIYFDHFGEGITNTFDRNGSFGLTTSEVNPAGIQSVDESARFSGLNNIPSSSGLGPLVGAPPTGPFPVTSPIGAINPGGFAITWGLDDKLKTPYSHVIDFSITRELPSHFVFEASYVGRFAHRLLQEEDLAEPTNLRDPQSKTTYFQAAQALARQYYAGTPIQNISAATIGTNYWENIFPGAAGTAANQLFGTSSEAAGTTQPCLGSALPNSSPVTATQAMYDLFCNFSGNETTALELADAPGVLSFEPLTSCFPSCATINGNLTQGYNYYSPQFSSLFAWRSIGNSAYNAGQFSLRHRANGLEFDLNYTLSKSIDMGSNAERISEFEGFGLGSQIINSWFPGQNRAVSDFDTRQIVNANWVYYLPFGRGKQFGSGMGRFANAIFGGWTVSGLWRWSTGYPFSTFSPAWSTNFQLQAPGVPISSARPKTGSYIVAQPGGGTGPNVFQDPGITDASTNPNAAINLFRPTFPGEEGLRNGLRGPGTFNIDTGVSKTWPIRESQFVKFNWSMYNVTNTARFDVGTMSLNGNTSLSSSSSFGNFSSTLSNPRVMEFMLRYAF